jgi:hypothetical protein
MSRVVDELSLRLMANALWETAKPLIPRFAARPQGGGSAPVDDRAIFTAIVFVLTSGCVWRHLPPSFGVTVPTAIASGRPLQSVTHHDAHISDTPMLELGEDGQPELRALTTATGHSPRISRSPLTVTPIAT